MSGQMDHILIRIPGSAPAEQSGLEQIRIFPAPEEQTGLIGRLFDSTWLMARNWCQS
jgi:hypothetical protein